MTGFCRIHRSWTCFGREATILERNFRRVAYGAAEGGGQDDGILQDSQVLDMLRKQAFRTGP